MPITIVPYDPQWVAEYAHEARQITAHLGTYIQCVEHIGSTAVPGLSAKPIIDIMIGVESLTIADTNCIKPIVAMGYSYIKEYEDVMPFRRYFRKLSNDAIETRGHTHHIHLVETGSNFWREHLLFRDYLRAHPADRDAYATLKHALATQFDASNDYTQAKTGFIETIKAKARGWRKANPLKKES